MTKMLALITAFGFCLFGAAQAASYKLDAKGKCRDEHGRSGRQELCEGQHIYKPDAKGKCHDERGKIADGRFCRAQVD